MPCLLCLVLRKPADDKIKITVKRYSVRNNRFKYILSRSAISKFHRVTDTILLTLFHYFDPPQKKSSPDTAAHPKIKFQKNFNQAN